MREPCVLAGAAGYQLCFRPLSTTATAREFRCDAAGRVDLDALSERERLDYLYARALIGRDFGRPAVQRMADVQRCGRCAVSGRCLGRCPTSRASLS